MGTSHGGVVPVHILKNVSLTYIGVGLSALLGLTIRVMRRPLHRGPGTELAPRFFVCMLKEIKPRTSAEVAGRKETFIINNYGNVQLAWCKVQKARGNYFK